MDTPGKIQVMGIVFASLFLISQYESWAVPAAVMLSVSVALLGALGGLAAAGIPIDIDAQIGLAAKNAILIGEFTKEWPHRRSAARAGVDRAPICGSHARRSGAADGTREVVVGNDGFPANRAPSITKGPAVASGWSPCHRFASTRIRLQGGKMIHKPARSRSIRPLSAGVAACSLLLVLAGCGGGEGPLSSSSGGTAARAPAPAGVSRDALVGRWGIASFHTEKDRKRTEAEARAQCKQPYTIAQGPGDGVIMHVADDPKPYELRLKAGAGSKTYLGFEAPAGDPQDRELLSVKPKELVMRFVDPDAHARYGTFIYSRCG